MAARIPARLTRSEGLRFALTVGLAFLALAAIAWLRGRAVSAAVLGALGALLVTAGLLMPSSLGPVYRAWMGLAHAISRVTTPVILGVLYFVIVTPTGWVRRLAGHRTLARTAKSTGFWTPRVDAPLREDMEHQF